MRFLSVCSGIEAASSAWEPLGWEPVAFSEIDAFPSAVLAHRYPDVPNWGDLTRYQEWPDAAVDVLVGGTPCQSFSVAGLRQGLADPRGNLALTYIALAERYRPNWLVWENVPGVFSAEDGDAFRSFIAGLVRWDVQIPGGGWRNAGVCEPNPDDPAAYGVAWRVLDAQHFGVAQRRRRVFVVGSARGWAAAAAVLLEPSCLRGDSAPRREAGEDPASCLAARAGVGGEINDGMTTVAPTVTAKWAKGSGGPAGDETQNLVPEVANTLTARMHKGINTTADEGQTPIIEPGDPSPTLASGARPPSIAFNSRQEPVYDMELTGALDTDATQAVAFTASEQAHPQSDTSNVQQGLAVRRLTPRECERLQGFHDNWTLIDYRGAPAKDGPRYKAIGNSMAVPVVRWLGERIEMVTELLEELAT